MDLTATLIVLAACVAIFAFGSWRSTRPADPLKPRMLPWRTIILIAGAVGVFMAVHVVNLLGIETGQQTTRY